MYRALRKADWDFDRAMRQLVKHSKRHKKHHEKHHEKHHDRETRVQERHHERHFFWHRSGVGATDQIIREGRHHDREARHHGREGRRHGRERRVQEKGRVQERQGDQTGRWVLGGRGMVTGSENECTCM